MIEGLKFDYTGEALIQHVQARTEHHLSRAEWHRKKAEEFKAMGIVPVESSYGATYDNVQAMEYSESDHRKRAARFLELGKHLVAEETYRLNTMELEELELTSRSW